MASEWPFVWSLGGGQSVWDFSMEPEYDEVELGSIPYLHRDAARAWQAFRDFLNGPPDQWRGAVSRAWLSGFDYGREDVR